MTTKVGNKQYLIEEMTELELVENSTHRYLTRAEALQLMLIARLERIADELARRDM